MFELTPYERRHQRALFNPFRDMENFERRTSGATWPQQTSRLI